MAYEVIQLHKENGVATITLNRPPLNPLNSQVFRELSQVADELQADASVKAVILTGAGDKAFAAGADVSEMVQLTPIEVYGFCKSSLIAFQKIENLSKPVIAAIKGLALGGGIELAMCCDIRLTADNAKFGMPEVNLGIIPGGGGTQRLPRLVGTVKAKEILFLGEGFDAAEAEKIGLVNKVVPADSLLEEAQKLAKKLAAKPAVAMRMLKAAVNTGINLDITPALNVEIQNFTIAFASDDRKEGIGAFLEKRKPNFTDK